MGASVSQSHTNIKVTQIEQALADIKLPNRLDLLLAEQSKLLRVVQRAQTGHEDYLAELAGRHACALFGLTTKDIKLNSQLTDLQNLQQGIPSFEDGPLQADYSDENTIHELAKRTRCNALIHGAASVVQEYYHLLRDELNACAPDLYENSRRLLIVSEAIFLLHMGNSPIVIDHAIKDGSMVGVTFLREDPESPTGVCIESRALIFPLLLHEIAKGIVEQIASCGLPQDPELATRILNTADKPHYEAMMLLQGYEAWRAISKTLGFGTSFEEARARTKFLIELFQLPAIEFKAEYTQLNSGRLSTWAAKTRSLVLK